MKATIDVPEAIYRRIKARSALEGRTVRDVTIELYQRWLQETASVGIEDAMDASANAERWLASWDFLGEEIARRAVDPRPTRDILLSDRR